jgi:hypothetical protein
MARVQQVAVGDEEPDGRPERVPGGRRDDRYDPPVVTWPRPEVDVAAVGAGCRFDDDADVDVELEVVVEDVEVSVAGAVAAACWPGFEIAATEPKAATAAVLASAVPRVILRIRWMAWSREAGVRRVEAFMAGVWPRSPFGLVTRPGQRGVDRVEVHWTSGAREKAPLVGTERIWRRKMRRN